MFSLVFVGYTNDEPKTNSRRTRKQALINPTHPFEGLSQAGVSFSSTTRTQVSLVVVCARSRHFTRQNQYTGQGQIVVRVVIRKNQCTLELVNARSSMLFCLHVPCFSYEQRKIFGRQQNNKTTTLRCGFWLDLRGKASVE